MSHRQRDELDFAELFDGQPESVVWFKPIWNENETSKKELIDFEVSYCNNATCTFLRTPKENIIGNRLLVNDVLDTASKKSIFEQSAKVYENGEPLELTYHNQHLNRYFNVIRSKVKDGILSISRDITVQYLMQKELEQQAKKFNTVINTSAEGIIILESIRDNNNIVDFSITHTNEFGAKLGRIPADAKGKPLLKILPHLKNSDQFNLHKNVVDTGAPVRFETSFRNEMGEEFGWFMVSLLKLEDGVLSRFVDLSEKKNNEEEILKQANFLNSVLEASINGVFVCEAIRDDEGQIVDLRMVKINNGFTSFIGKRAEEVEGSTFLTIFPTAKTTGLFDINCKVIETGEPVRKEVYYKGERLDAWYDISMVKLGENGLVVTFTDITEAKQSLIEIEQQRNLLDNILKHSPSGITVTEVIRNEKGEVIDGKSILANEASIRLTGIPKDLYLTKNVSELDPNIINSALFRMAVSTLENDQPLLTQYFLKDYRRWLELGVSKMDENRVVNVFTDVTQMKESQIQLEKLVEELKRSNAQLEEFTYVASHDLKEPVRKISVFTNQLRSSYTHISDAKAMRTWEKLELATERMQLLVSNLVEYADISNRPVEFEDVDLNKIMHKVQEDLEIIIEEKKAKIIVSVLPTIKGHRRQIQQLFQNIIANAIKYSKPETAPEINIQSRIVTGFDIELDLTDEQKNNYFYLIEIADNGIGFDQKHIQKIFNLFQRLHLKNEYSGTGVGLSIVRKVAENHDGYITAKSEKGLGAQFKVYLPRQS
jgi:signal transduction histidine kinase